jgi:flagellar basal-body rod protein FlgC
MKSAMALLLALGLLMFTVIEAEAAVNPNALKTDSNFACADLQKATQKLPIYAQNIENKDTTRTPKGGPYKRIDLVCHELYCETTARADFKLMKAPNHPDANGAGFVQMPRIDVPTQYASLLSAAAEIRLLAENKTCGASALGGSTMAMIKYGSTSIVQQDTFSYATDGHLTAWTRIMKDGTMKSYAFNQDGTILK